MRVDTREIMNGEHNGKTVWITHYNKPDKNKKPLRNIEPTQCIIMDNDEVEATAKTRDENGVLTKRPRKVVYYSKSHFAPLSVKGKPLKKVISPVDNTGYRSRSGNPLNVFTTELEAVESYTKEYNDVHPEPTHVSVDIEKLTNVLDSLQTSLEEGDTGFMNYVKDDLEYLEGLVSLRN